MNKEQMLEIVDKGRYYKSAWMHYLDENIRVKCDRCEKDNLYESIGYLDKDLCLSCVDVLMSSIKPNEHFVQSEKINMEINIKTLSGKTITINANPSDTIESIKMKVEEKEKIPIKSQQLIFGGKRLENNCTLSNYNIQNKDSLHEVLTLMAQDLFSTTFMKQSLYNPITYMNQDIKQPASYMNQNIFVQPAKKKEENIDVELGSFFEL